MIHINGVDWVISILKPVLSHGPHTTVGLTDFSKGTIDVAAGMESERTEQIFFHELLHIVLENEDLGIDGNEAVVGRSSALLYGILKDNNMLSDGWFNRIVDIVETDSQVENKRVIVDHVPPAAESGNVPFRPRDNEQALLASGGDYLDSSSGQGSHKCSGCS